MNLKELESLARAGGEAIIEIHSIEPSIYLVYQRFGERLMPVADDTGSQACFNSSYASFKALAGLGVTEVAFVHRSAYGEMIGIETPHNDTELRQIVSLVHLA